MAFQFPLINWIENIREINTSFSTNHGTMLAGNAFNLATTLLWLAPHDGALYIAHAHLILAFLINPRDDDSVFDHLAAAQTIYRDLLNTFQALLLPVHLRRHQPAPQAVLLREFISYIDRIILAANRHFLAPEFTRASEEEKEEQRRQWREVLWQATTGNGYYGQGRGLLQMWNDAERVFLRHFNGQGGSASQEREQMRWYNSNRLSDANWEAECFLNRTFLGDYEYITGRMEARGVEATVENAF